MAPGPSTCRRFRSLVTIYLLPAALVGAAPGRAGEEGPEPAPLPLEGVVFNRDPATLYVPAREFAAAFGLEVREERGALALGELEVSRSDRRPLPDGTSLVRLRALAGLPGPAVAIHWDGAANTARVRRDDLQVEVRRGRRTVLDGVTFAAARGVLYAPREEALRALRGLAGGEEEPELPEDWRPAEREARTLGDGTELFPVQALREAGAEVEWLRTGTAARVKLGDREAWIAAGPKRVAVSLEAQRLRAWQGERLVLDTRISSGRPGMETPTGAFRAGPLKAPMLISRKYGDAEMPWSVQVQGNVVIHGFPSVPRRAASHGCIRMPLGGRNAARWFYRWVDVGTPIVIAPRWPEPGESPLRTGGRAASPPSARSSGSTSPPR